MLINIDSQTTLSTGGWKEKHRLKSVFTSPVLGDPVAPIFAGKTLCVEVNRNVAHGDWG